MFPGTTSEAVNDPKTVGQNPWCQSDSEFRQAVAQEVGATNPQANPSFNYGMDRKKREETAHETAAKALNTILTSKITSYLDKFLEMGEEKLPGLLAHGIGTAAAEITNKIPIVDLIIDWIKDKIAERALDNLVEDYRTDRDRRLCLAGWRWGLYTDPEAASSPGPNDFTRQVLR